MFYQWHIIVLASFCAIAIFLIVKLLIHRSRHGRTKEALRTSEERYLLALAGSTDGLWDWDLLSDTVFYSDRFREILGYSVQEFPGTIDSFRDRLPRRSGPPSNAILKSVFHTRSNTACEQKPTIICGSSRVARQSGTLRERLSGCPALFRTLPTAS